MKLWKFVVLLFTLWALPAMAQTTTVSATVVDSDGTAWIKGTWTMQFVPASSQPNIRAYNIRGTPLDPAITTQTGTMDGTGVLTSTVYQNGVITPIGTQWKLTVCPLASSACGSFIFGAAGGSMNISSSLTGVIPFPRFDATAGAYGYTDNEARITLPVGATYWNTTSNLQRYYNGTAWINTATGGPFALPFPKEQGVQSIQFVGSASKQGCSNSNTGLSWGDCVADITTAWINLMNIAPGFGGTIYMIGGGACGGGQNALWVMGPFDKAWAIVTASSVSNGNGTSTLTVTNIGSNVGATPTLAVGEVLTDGGTANLPYSTITAFGTGVGGNGTYIISGSYDFTSQTNFGVPPFWLPQMRIKIIGMPGGHYINDATQALAIPCSNTVTPNFWFTGTNVNFKIDSIGNETGPQSLWLGIDSTTLGSSIASGFEISNDFLRIIPTQPNTAGPPVTIGGQVSDTHFYRVSINANSSAGRAIDGSNSTQAIVSKPGAQYSLDDSVIQYGDILYQDTTCAATGPNPGQLDIHRLRQVLNYDGKGAVWIPSHFCAAINIDNLQVITVQSPTTSAPAVEIDTSQAPQKIMLNNIEGKVTSGTTYLNFTGSPMPNILSQAGSIGMAFAMGTTFGPNVVDSSNNMIFGISRQTGNLVPIQSFNDIALCPNQQAGGFYNTPANCSTFGSGGSDLRGLHGNFASTAFASLPACGAGTGAGSFYGVTDATISGTDNTITGGGGLNKGLGYCDGLGWHLVWSYNLPSTGKLNTTGTANQVWGMNGAGTVQGWQNQAAAPSLIRWMSPWTGNTGDAPIVNTVRGWGFTLPIQVTFSTLSLISNLADANLYSAAIADTSGNLLCHPTTGTAISTANTSWDNACIEGSVTLVPGTYVLLYTGNSTTGKVQSASINTVVGPFFSNAIAGCSSASGVISGTCTIATSNAVYGTGIPSFSLH